MAGMAECHDIHAFADEEKRAIHGLHELLGDPCLSLYVPFSTSFICACVQVGGAQRLHAGEIAFSRTRIVPLGHVVADPAHRHWLQ